MYFKQLAIQKYYFVFTNFNVNYQFLLLFIAVKKMENEFPFNYAEKLMELEASLEDESTIETITQLN